ncbi:MAG: phosphoglucosamine mutase [Bacteroidetes bacterium]|nr:MAG: phosphoglucosamine mutase [Bacteroidota bacterium]
MTLIKSISGIRGTIGGNPGDSLSPIDIVKFSSAFAFWAQKNSGKKLIIIGRDARPSGEMVSNLVKGAVTGMGIDIIDLGLSTTPTVEMAVTDNDAAGGIIITASHNPVEWNALKLLNHAGEFVSATDGEEILQLAESNLEFAEVHNLGQVSFDNDYLNTHIQKILSLPEVDIEAIKSANLSVAVDAVNSSGGFAVPQLLEALGVTNITKLYCEPNGLFPHNPEPLPENLTELSKTLSEGDFDMGIVVDPDVDRLAFVCEDGSMFGEEYTLVAVADYILSINSGNTVSNLSSTRALRDVTEIHGGSYFASAVGEVNVVEKMKAKNAILGGEGNGGIILPSLHYGRDALVGIALFLSHYVKKNMKLSELRASYPEYFMAKKKIQLTKAINVDNILKGMANKYADEQLNTIDGLKIDFKSSWVHLRKSNTEPIIRIYTEALSAQEADKLANKIISEIEVLTRTNE